MLKTAHTARCLSLWLEGSMMTDSDVRDLDVIATIGRGAMLSVIQDC